MKALRNNVQLIGNLGRDVELTTFDSGTKMARITLATSDYYKNNKGEQVQDTQWHNVIAWGKLADTMATLLKKGTEVAINGQLRHRSFEGKDGNTKHISEIIARDFLKISKRELPF